MAKSLTDLQVSAYLLQAAMDQEEAYDFADESAGRERSEHRPWPH